MRQAPSLALALSLAELQVEAGDLAAARRTLGVFGALPRWRSVDLPLVVEAARAWARAGSAGEGVRLFERLLSDGSLTRDRRLGLLVEGAELARAAQDFTRAGRWDAEYARLTAPEPGATAAGPK
jgi:uncharacterized protein HemY